MEQVFTLLVTCSTFSVVFATLTNTLDLNTTSPRGAQVREETSLSSSTNRTWAPLHLIEDQQESLTVFDLGAVPGSIKNYRTEGGIAPVSDEKRDFSLVDLKDHSKSSSFNTTSEDDEDEDDKSHDVHSGSSPSRTEDNVENDKSKGFNGSNGEVHLIEDEQDFSSIVEHARPSEDNVTSGEKFISAIPKGAHLSMHIIEEEQEPSPNLALSKPPTYLTRDNTEDVSSVNNEEYLSDQVIEDEDEMPLTPNEISLPVTNSDERNKNAYIGEFPPIEIVNKEILPKTSKRSKMNDTLMFTIQNEMSRYRSQIKKGAGGAHDKRKIFPFNFSTNFFIGNHSIQKKSVISKSPVIPWHSIHLIDELQEIPGAGMHNHKEGNEEEDELLLPFDIPAISAYTKEKEDKFPSISRAKKLSLHLINDNGRNSRSFNKRLKPHYKKFKLSIFD